MIETPPAVYYISIYSLSVFTTWGIYIRTQADYTCERGEGGCSGGDEPLTKEEMISTWLATGCTPTVAGLCGLTVSMFTHCVGYHTKLV